MVHDFPQINFDDYKSIGEKSNVRKFVSELAGTAFFLWGQSQLAPSLGVWSYGVSYVVFKSLFDATMISALSFRNLFENKNVDFFGFVLELIAQNLGAFLGVFFFGFFNMPGNTASQAGYNMEDADITRTIFKEFLICGLLVWFVNQSSRVEIYSWIYIIVVFSLVFMVNPNAIVIGANLFVGGISGASWVAVYVTQLLAAVFVKSVQYYFD